MRWRVRLPFGAAKVRNERRDGGIKDESIQGRALRRATSCDKTHSNESMSTLQRFSPNVMGKLTVILTFATSFLL